MILGTPPGWNADAAALLKQFLDSPVGGVFLAHLASHRPSFHPTTDLNSVALQAKEIAGFERAINTIIQLSEPPELTNDQPKISDAYPDLDDETKWPKDGSEKPL